MVDFQSRDTRRGPTVDDDDSESSTDTEPEDATGDTSGENERTTEESLAEEENQADTDPLAEEENQADTDPLAEEENQADTDPLAESGDAAAETAESDDAAAPATPSRAIDVAVVTVAGDRAELEDGVTAAFEAAGHAVVRRERLRGGYDGIQQMVDALVERAGVDVVVTVGGVGLAADEVAIEAVHPLLEKALPGFGEAFRARLADHIGTGIVGVRSTAGISDGTLVFCLPGDPEAAELAVREILATEAPILVDQLEE